MTSMYHYYHIIKYKTRTFGEKKDNLDFPMLYLYTTPAHPYNILPTQNYQEPDASTIIVATATVVNPVVVVVVVAPLQPSVTQ